jgi:4-diphosphocytidyl-2-C-methyl-D-erythritol kinase
VILLSFFTILEHSSMMHAYAKINLGLYVVARRPDGYHDIETVFCRIGVADRIAFSASPDILVTSSSPEAPDGESNICYKAARTLRMYLGERAGVHIHLEKHVPVGAGLGGGSADAALVLKELPAFWNRKVGEADLLRVALELGSDVPYFLKEGAAVAKGRGEHLDHFPLDIPFTILLCNPNIHIATAWAYGRISPGTAGKPDDLKSIVTQGMLRPELLQQLRNDFESVVFEAYPEVRHIKEEMLQRGAVFALMSGSGSTLFAFFNDAGAADRLATGLSARGYRTFVTPPHFDPRGISG